MPVLPWLKGTTEPTLTGAGALIGNWAFAATPGNRPARRTRQEIREILRNMTLDSMAIYFLPQAQSEFPITSGLLVCPLSRIRQKADAALLIPARVAVPPYRP